MSTQMSLDGMDGPQALFHPEAIADPSGRLRGYTMFYAIVPDVEDAQRLALAAADLRAAHGLPGKGLPADKLHITLVDLGGFRHSLPQTQVDAAMAVAAQVNCPSLPIVFDRALSFGNVRDPHRAVPFVLRGDAGSDKAVARLRKTLEAGCKRAGLEARPSTQPHMTMLYDPQVVAEQRIEPVHWTATRFALIVSHVGLGHHQWLGQWRLG
jgi:2'-5' RNA ligase